MNAVVRLGTGAFFRPFTAMVAGLTDCSVAIKVEGSHAYTDGHTIVLPAEGIWELSQIRVQAGVSCHEIAHVWFQSNAQLPIAYQRRPGVNAARVRRACNVVLDVADETRFERAMPRGRDLFATAHAHVLKTGLDYGRFAVRPQPRMPEEDLLVMAILWTRSEPRSSVRRVLRSWRTVIGFRDVTTLLDRARERPRKSRFRPQRTAVEWKRVHGIIDKLIDVLESHYPQSALPTTTTIGTIATAQSVDIETDVWAAGVARAMAVLAPAVEATPALGIADRVEFEQALGTESGADEVLGQYLPSKERTFAFDQACYTRAYPIFKRSLREYPIGESISREEGLQIGSRLSRPGRAFVDGKCFQRRIRQVSADAAVAVLLDQSGSMADMLPTFLGAGAAFVDAIGGMSGMIAATWRFGTNVERVNDGRSLRHGPTMGGTATHLALRESVNWLLSRSEGRRTILLLTDGAPSEPDLTRVEAVRARQKEIQIAVGTLGQCQQACVASMPGCVVFQLDPDRLTSSLHVALRRLWPVE